MDNATQGSFFMISFFIWFFFFLKILTVTKNCNNAVIKVSILQGGYKVNIVLCHINEFFTIHDKSKLM